MKINTSIYKAIAEEIIPTNEDIATDIIINLFEAKNPVYREMGVQVLLKDPSLYENWEIQDAMMQLIMERSEEASELFKEMTSWAEQHREEFEQMVLDHWPEIDYSEFDLYTLAFFYYIVPEHFEELDDKLVHDAGYGDELDAINELYNNGCEVGSMGIDLVDAVFDEIARQIEENSSEELIRSAGYGDELDAIYVLRASRMVDQMDVKLAYSGLVAKAKEYESYMDL